MHCTSVKGGIGELPNCFTEVTHWVAHFISVSQTKRIPFSYYNMIFFYYRKGTAPFFNSEIVQYATNTDTVFNAKKILTCFLLIEASHRPYRDSFFWIILCLNPEILWERESDSTNTSCDPCTDSAAALQHHLAFIQLLQRNTTVYNSHRVTGNFLHQVHLRV